MTAVSRTKLTDQKSWNALATRYDISARWVSMAARGLIKCNFTSARMEGISDVFRLNARQQSTVASFWNVEQTGASHLDHKKAAR